MIKLQLLNWRIPIIPTLLLILLFSGLFSSCNSNEKEYFDPPNIIYILADDMGYGDVEALNPECKIPTPNLNSLAAEGMTFTDAHSNSAVCTPTRYGVLTGRYAWRTHLQKGVLGGYSSHLITPETETVASFLKKKGYATACIGKWHLGWDWQTIDGYEYSDGFNEKGDHVDWSQPIKNGPVDIGFDYFFGIPSSLDIPPYVYVENDKVTKIPESIIEANKGYGFYRSGDISSDFKHETVLSTLTNKVCEYIEQQKEKESPFFVYFPMPAPHTPILPEPDFVGKSGVGPYGDFVNQCDFSVGQIVETLQRNGLEDNTLIIFTSDNGCSPMANFKNLAEKGHNPNFDFRGHKADIFDGGHRVPFIAKWPFAIQGNTTNSAIVSLTDLLATASDILEVPLEESAGVDSESMFKKFLQQEETPAREAIVHHSVDGYFSIRQGKWKLIFGPGSGGWSSPKTNKALSMGLPMVQLYDLDQDIGEQNNLQDKFPEVVKEMTELMVQYIDNGRSTPGTNQQNDVPVELFKAEKMAGEIKPQTVDHLAKNAGALIKGEPKLKHTTLGAAALTDGRLGSVHFDDGNWIGIQGEDLEFKLDLGEVREINSIEMGFLQDQKSWIFLPEFVEISFDTEDVFTKKWPSKNEQGKKREQYKLTVPDLKSRYVNVKITGVKTVPSWHEAARGKAWVFVDEIIVN